jgi:pimeloyl-ACP methyl ester carboxylesterase/DNA-binding CsgD family transcriptional regulator
VGFCEVPGGHRVAYATTGSGPPLVMVPGWMSHVTELWSHPAASAALRKLSDGHRFVWYDRLGCGLSDREAVTLSLEDDVAQLEAVMAALGINRCDLIGYSFGGPVAALFAHRNPTRVRHLVLYSTYAYGADLAEEAPYQALVSLVRSGWGLSSVTLAALFLPDSPRADLKWFSRFQRRSVEPETAADLLEYLRIQDVRDVLPFVRVPTTVVTAEEDRVVTPVQARELARRIPGARLVTVEGRTHDPFIRDEGDVVEAILAAVEGRPTSAPATAPPPSLTLTPRELDVLQALVAGSSNKAIAAELGISVATVERHLTNVYRKLGATARADAAVKAVSRNLVTSIRA